MGGSSLQKSTVAFLISFIVSLQEFVSLCGSVHDCKCFCCNVLIILSRFSCRQNTQNDKLPEQRSVVAVYFIENKGTNSTMFPSFYLVRFLTSPRKVKRLHVGIAAEIRELLSALYSSRDRIK